MSDPAIHEDELRRGLRGSGVKIPQGVKKVPPRPLLTNSRLGCYALCPRKHELRYELAIVPDVEAEPLTFGSAFHEALEVAANIEETPPETREAAPDLFEQNLIETVCGKVRRRCGDGLMAETVVRLWLGHRWRYRNDGLDLIVRELRLNAPIFNPATGGRTNAFAFAGKADGIVRLSDGRLALLENKTTRSAIEPDSDYWLRLRLDQQISLYVNAARTMGHQVEAVVYDVVRKPGIQPRKLSRPEMNAFREGRAAREVERWDWFGYSLNDLERREVEVSLQSDPPLSVTENDAMLDARRSTSGSIKLRPRKVKPEELVGLRDGIDDPEIQPGEWFGEVFAQDELESVDEENIHSGSFRESSQMFGARLTAEIVADPTRYFARHEIARGEDDLEMCREDLWSKQKAIAQSERTGRWYRNTQACLGLGRCEYLDVCAFSLGDLRDEELPRGFRRASSIHPELEEEVSP